MHSLWSVEQRLGKTPVIRWNQARRSKKAAVKKMKRFRIAFIFFTAFSLSANYCQNVWKL
jgi:hypothetical protein